MDFDIDTVLVQEMIDSHRNKRTYTTHERNPMDSAKVRLRPLSPFIRTDRAHSACRDLASFSPPERVPITTVLIQTLPYLLYLVNVRQRVVCLLHLKRNHSHASFLNTVTLEYPAQIYRNPHRTSTSCFFMCSSILFVCSIMTALRVAAACTKQLIFRIKLFSLTSTSLLLPRNPELRGSPSRLQESL